MRRYFYLWMVMFLALMMAIPIHPMAQTQTPLKLRLMTETGDMITTNSPIIKNFFLSSDGILAVILDSSQGALNFTFPSDETDIGIKGITNCTIPGDGSVTATAGGGEFQFLVYSIDSGATISAPALPGGTFNSGIYKWTPTTWNVGTYLAVFEASLTGKKTSQIVVMIKIVSSTQYNLTLLVNPSGAGNVTGAGSYAAGSTATMTAQATGNYTFVNWTENGYPVGSAPTSTTNTITMNSNHNITANFTTGQQQQYTLTLLVNPTGAGNVTGAGSYTAGSTATMTAQATGNYTFVNWTENGTPVGSAPTSTTNTITMNSNHNITANFTTGQQQQYTLTLLVNPTGAGNVTGAGSYTAGSTATMTAQATGNYTFVNWTENGTPVGSAPTSTTNTITMSSNHNITANFTSSGKKNWSAEIASATPINGRDEKSICFFIYEVPILKGGIYYFLADPKGVGSPYYSNVMSFSIRDTDQGTTMNIANPPPTLYKVDTNGDQLAKYDGYGSGDFGVRALDFTQAEYDKGVRFLLEIIEKGKGPGKASSISWCPY